MPRFCVAGESGLFMACSWNLACSGLFRAAANIKLKRIVPESRKEVVNAAANGSTGQQQFATG